ncbi:hypothetical protein GGR50DRAFT_664744 [Xylaria sp. CBS 124048]|nr:hypothetical protein GGR50DRAFT_664744 [Xylaria sp. CBS 124048]
MMVLTSLHTYSIPTVCRYCLSLPLPLFSFLFFLRQWCQAKNTLIPSEARIHSSVDSIFPEKPVHAVDTRLSITNSEQRRFHARYRNRTATFVGHHQ